MTWKGPCRRTAIFLIALGVLLAFATRGTPRPTLLVLLMVFIAAATIWTRGQYAESLTGKQWVPSWKIAVTFMAIGVALIVVYVLTSWGGTGLGGAIAVYFGSGFLVTRRRQNPGHPLTAAILLGTGLLGLILGFAGLGRWNVLLSALLLVLPLLLLVPIGLQLASEHAIRWLKMTDGPWRLVLGFGGAALFVVVAAIAAAVANSSWLLAAIVVLGLVVVAIASETQADIVAVIALLALLGVTPHAASVPAALTPGGGSSVLVALGDSYMSGEGASVFYKGTDHGGGDQCHRAPTAWAAIAGQQAPFDRLAFLACSGARSYNVRTDGSIQKGEPATQLTEYRRLQQADPFTPRMVVVSLGGNDAGFSTIGEMCLAPGNCDTQKNLWLGSLPQVKAQLEATYTEVAQTFPSTPVVVTAYPDPIADVKNCGQLALNSEERSFIRTFVGQLDATVEQVATDHGFYYLGQMRQALAQSHLQLCDPGNDGRPGLNFIGLRSVQGIAEQRFNPANWLHNSLHPNEQGHQALLRVFQTWLTAHPTLTARTGAVSPAATGSTAVTPTPPCELISTRANGCTTQGRNWAERQIGDVMVPAGIVLGVLAGLGAWAAGVALFGWRRRSQAWREDA